VERENRLSGAREMWLALKITSKISERYDRALVASASEKNPAAHKKGSAAADRPSCRQSQVVDPDLGMTMVFTVDIGGSEPDIAIVNGCILTC
jgi:hypothetical protein